MAPHGRALPERGLPKRGQRPAAFASPPVADDPSPLAAGLRSVRTVADRHRRLLASVCAGGAVVVAVAGLTPAASDSSSPDADRASVSALLPAGAGDMPAGQADRVAVAVRLADAAGLLLVRAGSHAELLAGPGADVAAVPAASGTALGRAAEEVLAADAVVVAVPQPPMTSSGAASGAAVSGLLGSSSAGGGSGGLEAVVVLAVPPADAGRIAAAAGTRPLSVAVGLPPRP